MLRPLSTPGILNSRMNPWESRLSIDCHWSEILEQAGVDRNRPVVLLLGWSELELVNRGKRTEKRGSS